MAGRIRSDDVVVAQASALRDFGCVRFPQLAEGTQVASMRAHIVDELARLKLWPSGKASSSIASLPAFRQIAKLSSVIAMRESDAQLIVGATRPTVAAFAPPSLTAAPAKWLVSLPRQGAWTLHGLNWHTDLSPARQVQTAGIQAFVLIDDVAPHGGATLAIAGSHRLDESAAEAVRGLLRGDGDIENGLHRYGLSLLEMAGRAGDVYLMDMRLLHTPSINATAKVRMMATVRYLPDDRSYR